MQRFIAISFSVHALLLIALAIWEPMTFDLPMAGVVRVLLVGWEASGAPEEERAAAPGPAAEEQGRVNVAAQPVPPKVAMADNARARQDRRATLPVAPAEGADATEVSEAALRAGIAPTFPGARAEGTAAGGAASPDRRIAEIRRRIQSALRYPREARRRQLQGTAHVRFEMNKDGTVHRLALSSSSGQRMLDSASMETVERAAPFPFVDGALVIPVVFRLSD